MLVSKCSITVACNQLFIKVHKQTYHIENTESKKTEKDETKKNIYKKKSKSFEYLWRLRRRKMLLLRREDKDI